MPEDTAILTLEKKARDLERALAELKYVENEQLMILSALEAVNEISTIEELIPAILDWMKKWSGCDAVGIRLRDGEDFPYYTTSGFPEKFVRLERFLCSYDEHGIIKRDTEGCPVVECMCGNVICGRVDPSKKFFTADGSFWSNCTTRLLAETSDEDRQIRTRNRCNGFGYESVALIPLCSSGETFGLLQFNDHEEGKFSARIIAAYRRVADQVASSLTKLKAADSLKNSKVYLKAVLEKAQDIGNIGAWELDVVKQTLVWTDENYRIFGIPKGTQLTHQRVLECIHPDDMADLDEAWSAAVRGKPYDIEHRIIADGTVKWVRQKARLEFDRMGNCIRGIGVTQDITPMKQKEIVQSVKLRLTEKAPFHSVGELVQRFLDELEVLTESTIGFYHLIDHDKAVLRLQALSSNTLKLKKISTAKVPEGHYPIPEAGVWGDSFFKRSPMVYNQVTGLSCAGRLWEGLGPVERMLTVPVLRAEKVVAILGVGNRKADYTGHEVDMVRELADLSWEAISLKRSSDALRESEQRFRTLFEKAPIGISLSSPQGLPTHINQALVTLLGRSKKTLCEKPLTAWTHPDDLQKSVALIDRIRDGLADHETLEKRYLHKNGDIIWAHTDLTSIRRPSGELEYMIAMVQDITEQKKNQESLRASEEALQKAHKLAGIGSWQWDIVANRHTWSEEIYHIYGRGRDLPPAEYPEVQMYFTRESWAGLASQVEVSIARGLPYEYDAEVIRPDGEHRWITARGGAVRDKDGRVVRLHGTVQDITERKQAERLLQWNVRRYEILSRTGALLLQSSEPQALVEELCRDVMHFLDCQVFMNFLKNSKGDGFQLNALAGIPEYSKVEWPGPNTSFASLDGLMADLGIHVHSSTPLIIEGRSLGNLIFGRQTGPQFLAEEVEMMASVANLVAIAVNRIETEKEKISLEAQLRQAQKVEAIGRLAGGIAHDLNNMLCPILSYAQLLAEELSPGDERRDQAMEIVDAGFKARDLVRQLLAFSRKQVIRLKPLDMNQVVRGMEKLLLRTIPEDIKLEKRLSRKIRPVLADIGQIEQIIMNLTVNAADAMPGGGLLRLSTQLATLDEAYAKNHPDVVPGQYVMLSVSDTGSGMDNSTLARAFDPFFSTKGDQGTGLGLATVYGIVRQHAGNIVVHSEPGIGTTFKVYIPATHVKPEKSPSVQRVRKGSLKAMETILLSEDNDQVRQLGRTILERQGYKVLEAGNGDEALQILDSHEGPVHLLLTDVIMPGINGKELYKRAVQTHPSLKVLYMSGYTDDIIAHRGMLDKGISLIEKPFSVHRLVTRVRDVLSEDDS